MAGQEGTAWIRKELGNEMAPQHFSAVKSRKKEGGARSKRSAGRKPREGASQAIEGYLAPPPKSAPSGEQSDLLEAMEGMKPLVASLGVER